MEDDALWAEQYDKSDTDSNEEGNNMYDDVMTHEQMFSEERDEVLGFESILLILVHPISGLDSKGFIGPKNGCIFYASATYTWVYIR